MGGQTERNRAELAADVAVAAMFAAALAFAHAAAWQAGPGTAAIAVAGFLAVMIALEQVAVGERYFSLPAFEPAPIEPIQEQDDGTAELLLHDRLAAVNPEARIVQLFGPSRGRGTGGFDRPGSATELPDASQALIDALSELRRSFH